MGTTLLTATEQILYENTEVGEYHGYVFVQNMATGDTVSLYVYIKNPEDSTYYLGDSLTLSGAQALPAIRVYGVVGKVGIKITAKQTVGTPKSIDHCWFQK
jgi:hypothetical protein